MLFLDGLDTVEEDEKRVLQGFGMPVPVSVSPRVAYARQQKPYLCNSSLAALPRVSISSLVRLGLIDLTSSGARGKSRGPASTESRCMIMVPLLFRLGRRGLVGTGA